VDSGAFCVAIRVCVRITKAWDGWGCLSALLRPHDHVEALRVAELAQYSSARMMVSTRVVTAGSTGSGEPNSVARS
jgi:hypothetical protein